MIARYPLSKFIASFDFYTWLVVVQARGATEVAFDPSAPKLTKWDDATVKERFESILLPGPALAGMPCQIAGGIGQVFCSPHMSSILEHIARGLKFRRLRSVKPPGMARYTVTLRQDRRRPDRNSNEAAWRKFAKEIGAHVIEDYEVEPIHLHDRMALYAGAEMNFGIMGGPTHMLTLTEYPITVFAPKRAEGGFINFGMAPGEQYPWNLPQHRIVWAEDDYDTIMRTFEAWHQAAA